MNSKKGMVAFALATTLALGSSLTAFAADTTGNTIGAGTSEGHVNKTVTNVVLPTIAEGTTPFAYTMDPEGLVGDTAGGKYETGTTFPETADDTGVYFLTAEKTYANTSSELKVTNESSHSIELTVKAEVESAATDIALAEKDELAASENAALYLGLIVGAEDAVAVNTETAVTKTVTLAGKEENFKVDVNADKSGYEYRVLTLDEYKAIAGNESATEIAWESTTFKVEGATTTGKEITDSTTAPTLKVTWSWVDPTAAPGFTADTYTYTAGSELVANVNLPEDASAVSIVAYKVAGSESWTPFTEGTDYTYANGSITFPADSGKLYTVASGLSDDMTVSLGCKIGDTIYEAALVLTK